MSAWLPPPTVGEAALACRPSAAAAASLSAPRHRLERMGHEYFVAVSGRIDVVESCRISKFSDFLGEFVQERNVGLLVA